jgi:hypothetical protein
VKTVKIDLRMAAVVAALTLGGCAGAPDRTTGDKPGGRGAPDEKTVHGPADDSFNLSSERAFLRQGERRTMAVTIYRNVNFKDDVTLGFGELPKGVSVDDSSPVIKRNDSEAHFALTASDDASIGDFSIRITGHPSKGADASNDFNITVAAKK